MYQKKSCDENRIIRHSLNNEIYKFKSFRGEILIYPQRRF